ncbi:MAG: hypothetical protein HY842_04140 [Bacteroidetes bacterium]|nr:hypothetical protein [Bacteroidota bacterium]
MKKNKEAAKAINCEEAVMSFNDFIDNYLKGKARDELVKHISECRHCFERFEFEQLLKSKVHQLPMSKKNQPLISRIEKMIASL